MTGDDDHRLLRAAWTRLHTRLRDLRVNLEFGDTYLMEFADKADRAANLALHLEGAVKLVDQHLYAPALAVTRTSIEHVVLDALLFRGRTWVQNVRGISTGTWEQWQADREAGAEWTAYIVKWTRTKRGDVRICREGIYTNPDDQGNRERLSIYYFLLEEYDGSIGRPVGGASDTARDDEVGFGRQELRALARENEARWRTYLTWSALLDNLAVNDLAEEADVGRLGVHYRFLSAYAHPVSHTHRRLYGDSRDGSTPHYDHYASELVLLYVVTLAMLELVNFAAGLASRTDVTLGETDSLNDDLDFARRATDHFWFIGTNPHPWDFNQARNQAAFRLLRDGQREDVATPDPADVPFPRDPLRRLVDMHASSSEVLTGYVYQSPWRAPTHGDAGNPNSPPLSAASATLHTWQWSRSTSSGVRADPKMGPGGTPPSR
ncbi:hypothetical protein [Nocardioides conyzicola]|uniref:Uncharacterized protein n=1 Tax=Nocardioides conyzicola TaxID=1651781 RepID=A0ABP8XZV2_9ACTN